MDTLTHRILDTLSSNLNEPLSINQLTTIIKQKYGTGNYKNIYEKLQHLKREGLINQETIGRSTIIKLNTQNYLLTDFLSQIEIEKKLNFLKNRTELLNLLIDMEHSLNGISSIKSISTIDPTRNIKLNRIELLILLNNTSRYQKDTARLFQELKRLQNKYNLRIDSLILHENDFSDLLRSKEINPLREALTKETILYNPQAFWSQIRQTIAETEIKIIKIETKPTDIPEQDLIYNLTRFGYTEFGSTYQPGKPICIEYIVTSLLLSDNIRRQEAIPIILSKNSFKTNLLVFLTQKYETAGKLLSLLRILHRIKPTNPIHTTISILETLNVREIPTNNEKDISQKMRLYNVA